jgi:predicted nucleic acid-binding protein
MLAFAPIWHDSRARRPTTSAPSPDIELLAVDSAILASWALLRVHLADTGRRLNVNDPWIAATALAHGIPVVTQDDDFEPIDGTAGLSIIRV